MSAIGAAAILGGASLLSGLFGVNSQKSANAQNYKIFKEQMQYDKWKFQEEQRYNSQYNQMMQLRRAGLNPALVNGNSSSISAGSTPSANPMNPVDYSSFLNAGSAAAGALSSASLQEKQGSNIDSQTALNEIDAQTKGIKNYWELAVLGRQFRKLGWDSKILEKQAENLGLSNEYLSRTMGDRVEQQTWQSEYLRAQTESQLLANKYAERRYQAELNEIVSRAYANYASGRSSLQQAHTQLMNGFAQFGSNPKERKAFFDATLRGLIQSKKTAQSTEFRNYLDARPITIGMSSVGATPPLGVRKAREAAKRR